MSLTGPGCENTRLQGKLPSCRKGLPCQFGHRNISNANSFLCDPRASPLARKDSWWKLFRSKWNFFAETWMFVHGDFCTETTPSPSGLLLGHPSPDVQRLVCTFCPLARIWPLPTAEMIELAGSPPWRLRLCMSCL